MEKRIFLTGPTGCGKSSMLRRVLGESLSAAGGLVTERAMDEQGGFLGYELLPAASLGGVQGYRGELYLDCRSFPPAHDTEVFRTAGVRLLEEAGWYPFALLDELGGFELIIPQFRKALEELLDSDTPCVGALRSKEDAAMLRQLLGLGERYEEHVARLYQALEADGDSLVLDLGAGDAEKIEAILTAWAEEYAR